jgi:hypothetical protein
MKAKYNKLMKEMHEGFKEAEAEMAEMGLDVGDASMAYDLAANLIHDEPWAVKYLNSTGVRDIHGRLADDIAYGV